MRFGNLNCILFGLLQSYPEESLSIFFTMPSPWKPMKYYDWCRLFSIWPMGLMSWKTAGQCWWPLRFELDQSKFSTEIIPKSFRSTGLWFRGSRSVIALIYGWWLAKSFAYVKRASVRAAAEKRSKPGMTCACIITPVRAQTTPQLKGNRVRLQPIVLIYRISISYLMLPQKK